MPESCTDPEGEVKMEAKSYTHPATKRAKSKKAQGVVHDLIVVRGLSYVDAITRCEQMAFDAAAPYKEAADVIQNWLERPRA